MSGRGAYPPVTPNDRGLLEVGDGHRVYWEESGSSGGMPVVVLHGGPGSGASSGMRRFFDPDRYRIVLLDQRGCGRSTPSAADPRPDLGVNTTAHLVDDLERLRSHLRIDRWVVFGVSWGTTLGLAYAERHPDRVAGMVLAGVALGRLAEIDWLYRGLGRLRPAAWQRFTDGVDAADGDLVEAYHRLLLDPDPGVHGPAARRWTEWDWSTSSVDPPPLPPRWADPAFQLARARICTHFFRHACFLREDEVIASVDRLAGIRGILVNGRDDLQCPIEGAEELAAAWSGSELVVVDDAGHSTADPGMDVAIVAATDALGRS